jgi:hypothetical protein
VKRLAATIGLACAWLACATGPTGPVGTASLPAVAAGRGRLVLYHTNDTDMTMFHPMLTVAGEAVGELPVGSFLYVDRLPGVYPVGVLPQPNVSAFGGQAPTQPVAMSVAAGASSYLRVGVVPTPVWVEVTLTPMDPSDALRDLASLRLMLAPASGD